MTGFVNLYKPEGMSSAYAVGKVKKLFNCPCGHMGTLDPMASGILPIGIGKTSRLFNYLLDKNKVYVAEFTFGYETDTLDKTGKKVFEGGRTPSIEDLEDTMPLFLGDTSQVPPSYSAKVVKGQRSYYLARNGVEIKLDPKIVHIDGFRLVKKSGKNSYKFEITCKGGTYIRSICRDLAHKLGTYATMTKLERTQSGIFNVRNSIGLDEIINAKSPEELKTRIISADMAVDYTKISLKEEQAQRIINGVFDKQGLYDGLYRVYRGKEFLGIGKSVEGVLKIESYIW